MPTPAEQKALAFVAMVILLGGAVRVVRAGSSAEPTPLEQQALARQSSAVDSAASNRSAKTRRTGRRLKTRIGDTLPRVVGGVSSIPHTFARPGEASSHTPYGSRSAQLGFPPPSPRIDSDLRGLAPSVPSRGTSLDRRAAGSRSKLMPGQLIDMDVASESEIDRLPRIGPVLARRIVANRDSFGPFRNLDGLGRVKGMGPASIQRLAELISFSGSPASRRLPNRN